MALAPKSFQRSPYRPVARPPTTGRSSNLPPDAPLRRDVRSAHRLLTRAENDGLATHAGGVEGRGCKHVGRGPSDVTSTDLLRVLRCVASYGSFVAG